MKVVTILVVLTLALSMVAPIAAASGDRGYTESVSPISSTASIADHDGPPPGMVGVPSSNVGPPAHAGPSAHANIPTDAAAWSLHADKHADTLELEIDATSSGEPVLRAIDDKNHEGRTIAVDATTLADAVGHRPAVAHGDHSSGEEWSAGIDYENGYAKIDVPKFSTNEITFDGEVNVRGNVSDGSTLTYDIDSADGVDEVNATLTGTVNSEWNNHSASASAGESDPINIGGNVDPGGPANGNPQLTATGVLSEHSKYYNETLFTSSGGSTSLTYTNVSGSMDQVIVDQMIASWGSGAYNVYYDLIVEVNGNEEHRSSHSMDGGYGDDADEYKVHDISGVNVSDGDDVTVTFQQTGSDDFSTEETVHGDYVNITMAGSDVSASVNSESFDFSGLDPGETASKEVTSLSTGEEQIDWSGTGSVDWSLEINERAETVDPSIEVNGESDGYTGRLSEGETKSLNISASTITEGTNTINVSTGTSNGVITTAELDYTHPAPTDQSVSYESQTWSERYNVSRTWDSATLDASVTIPFASSRVVAIRDVEMRTNGGSWSAVPSSSYTLDGTTLEVGLGDVNEGDEIGVRANGSKVTVENGAIDVVEPTIEGNTLDTQLEIAEKSDGFGIDVGGTSEGNWLHKTANESWTAAETYTTITASGSQTIRAPGASSGATMNVRTTPLEVSPNAGELDVAVKESSNQMTFSVDPSSSVSEVEYRYHDTISGETYYLYSETHEVVRDSDTAQSPVTLSTSSFEETLSILLDSGSSSSTSTGGGGGGAIATAGSTAAANPLLTLVVGVIALAGTALVAARTSIDTRVVAGVGFLVLVLGLETISPGTITEGVRSVLVMLGSGAGPVMPLVILITVSAGAYSVIKWIQGRSGPDTSVTFQLSGGKNK